MTAEKVLDALARGATVITANERIARTLTVAWDQRQLAAGQRAWRTPAVFSWQAWMARLWDDSLAVEGAAARHVLLTAAQERALWRKLMADGTPSCLPGEERALARLAQRSWRSCQQWRVGVTELAGAADSADTLAFAQAATRFRQLCRSRDWVDAGMLPALLATDLQRGSLAVPASVHFVGFAEWTPLQREFLRVLAGRCEVHEQGMPAVAQARIVRVSAHDQSTELEWAARWARRRIEIDPRAAVAIVVPDLSARTAEVRRRVLDVLAPDWRLSPVAELPVNFSYGMPLSAYGAVQTARLLLSALEPWMDRLEAGQLLRSPHVPGAHAEAGSRAALDFSLRERPGRQLSLRRLAAEARQRAPVFSGLLERLQALGGERPVRQSAAGWARTFRQSLKTAGWPGDHGLASDEYQVAMALDLQLDALGSCDPLAGEISCTEALDVFHELLDEELFQPAGVAAGLQVMGVLEALGQSFDALWVCGLSSEAWPPAVQPDPLLALDLQRRLGMPDSSPAAARERAERRLRWLETSAAEVVLSAPQFREEETLTISPLIAQVESIDAAALDLWNGTCREALLLAARASELLDPDPAPALERAALPLRGGVALLEHQARCPARAFLQFRLGARELAQPATGIDPRTRGRMLHDVLQAFFQTIGTQEQLRDMDPRAQETMLGCLIDAQLRRHLPDDDALLGALARLERERLHQLIAEFLAGERQREPFFVVSTEQYLSLDGAPPALRALGLRVRLDRMDESPDGRRLVIDYKTSRRSISGNDLIGPRPRAPQLPLYALCADADAVALVQFASGGIRWLGVGRGAWGVKGIRSPEQPIGDADAAWGHQRAEWWSALQRLGEEILQGDFRVDRWRLEDARGQWAMATRVFELQSVEHSSS